MEELPDEVLELILANLSGDDLIRCSEVCKRWYNIISSNSRIWKEVVLREKIKQEQDLAFRDEEFVKKHGLWRTYYCLHAQRCRNWKNNKYRTLEKFEESWFYQGFSSFCDLVVIPSYVDNIIQIFKVGGTELVPIQQIELPVSGLEPIIVTTRSETIIAVKSNITLLYKLKEDKYKLSKIYACECGKLSIKRFQGNVENLDDVSSFIKTYYVKCGMVKVIEYQEGILWLRDWLDNVTYFVIKDDEFSVLSRFFPGIHMRTSAGYVCVWSSDTLVLYSINGNILFELSCCIRNVSFNEKFMCLRHGDFIDCYDIKQRKKLHSISIKYFLCMTVHDDSIYVLDDNELYSKSIVSGEVRWKIPYSIRGSKNIPFECHILAFLGSFLIVLPKIRLSGGAREFAVLDIKSGKFLYTSRYSGILVDISDKLLVTYGSRRDNVEIGNTLHIRCYI